LRAKYAAAGYGHGHRVALLCGQWPEYWFHPLALNALGCGCSLGASSGLPIIPADRRHDLLELGVLGDSLGVTAKSGCSPGDRVFARP
jgi:hypothetical protein